jgi:hypothetical protein
MTIQKIISSGLLFDEVMHGVFALPFVYLIWRKTKSRKLALVTFLTAYLIDIDHLVDYFAFYGFRFNLLEFLGGVHFKYTRKAFVPFHAWEWVLLLGILAKKRGWKSYVCAVVFGLIPHLIYDSISQSSIFFYSIILRSFNNFGFFW